MNKRVARTGLAILLALCAAPCLSRPATDNLVVSEQAPALSLRISADFAALPPLRFPIDNLTHAERRLFVEADANGRVRRMVVVQFERVQDGSAFRFVFPSIRRTGSASRSIGPAPSSVTTSRQRCARHFAKPR